MAEAVFCPECGSKLSARRRRCPRCRADLLAQTGEAGGTPASIRSILVRRYAVPAGIVVFVSGVLVAVLMPRAPVSDVAMSERPSAVAASHQVVAESAAGVSAFADPIEALRFAEPGRLGGAAYSRGD